MPIQDSLSHAAAVAKWKADQQMRLLKSQSQVRGLEGQIKTQKDQLAETTLTLYTRQRLSEDELQEICAAITQLQEQISQQQTLQETTKHESPPEQTHPAAFLPSSEQPVTPKSGQFVCPTCGRIVPVRFCPEHGVEGVPVP